MAALKIKPVRNVNIAKNNLEYPPVNIMKQEQNQSLSWWKWSILMVADVATRRWTCNIKTHWRDSRWRTLFLTLCTPEDVTRQRASAEEPPGAQEQLPQEEETSWSPGWTKNSGCEELSPQPSLHTSISWCCCTAADDGAQRLKDSAPPVCSHQRWGPPEVPVRTPPGSSSFLSQQHNSNQTVHTATDGLCWLILLWLLFVVVGCGCCCVWLCVVVCGCCMWLLCLWLCVVIVCGRWVWVLCVVVVCGCCLWLCVVVCSCCVWLLCLWLCVAVVCGCRL